MVPVDVIGILDPSCISPHYYFDWFTEVSGLSVKLESSFIAYYLVFVAAFILLWREQAAVRLAFGLVWALLFAMRARTPAAAAARS